MPQPPPYDRQANFSNFEAVNPTEPKPGASLDAEFNAIKITSDQTLSNLAMIQRDDGALANEIVTSDSLHPSLSIGFTLRGPWAAPENYLLADGVTYDNAFWRCEVSHLSEISDPPDDADPKWTKVVDFNDFAPAVIPDNSIESAKYADNSITTPKIANAAVTLAKQANVATGVFMGRSTSGTGSQETLSPATARGMLGQQWIKVLDQKVASPVTAIDIDLQGLDEFRIELIVALNPAVADFSIGWQTSTDGVNFASGGSDYFFQVEYFTGTVGSNSGSSSRGELHAGVLDTGTSVAYAKFTMEFSRGRTGVNPRMTAEATTYNGTAYVATRGLSERVATGAVTHLRLAANVANGMGIGTRCVVEGC